MLKIFLITILITYFGKPDIIVEYEENGKSNEISTIKDARWYRNVKIAHYFLFVFTPLSLFLWAGTPNKKEAVLIIGGGYVGNFISTDSSAKKLPSDIVYFLRSNLQLAAKESQVELQNLIQTPPVDTLSNKSKEELLEIIKSKK